MDDSQRIRIRPDSQQKIRDFSFRMKEGETYKVELDLCATLVVHVNDSGADPKSVQAQLRHSRIGPTMEIYAQCVAEVQQRAVLHDGDTGSQVQAAKSSQLN